MTTRTRSRAIAAAAAALLLGATQIAHAQTVVYKETFNALPQGIWKNNVDQAKIKAHPENAGIASGCGPDGSNCFKVIYRQADGIHKAPESSPVFATSGSTIDWAASDSTHTNTATDVTQDNLMIDGTTNDLGKDTNAPVPGKAYTLTYDVYFEPGFDFAKGGKLPGLAALGFDSGCTEDGNAKRAGTHWSVRLMWRANGRVELYSYDQTRPSGSCGIDRMIDAQAGDPPYEVPGQIPSDDKFRFKPGVWYTITLGVKVNSNDSVVYQKDANGQFVLDGTGSPIPLSGDGAEYLHIESADHSVQRTLVYPDVPLRDECNGTCPAQVPDTPSTWINGVFFSTFFGGNETKRTTCLSTTPPSYPGLTQAVFDKLCTSQRVAYIFPNLTWSPQVPSAARFDNFMVVSGYPATGDTTAPTAPTSLSATAASPSQINLLWIASTDNMGVTGYRVYRGTTLVGSPLGTSFSDTGLTPSTTYLYTVKAIDAAGNLSPASAAKSATTLPVGGTTTTLPATDDSYVRDGSSSSNNYGTETSLYVKNDPGANRRAYLKFNLAGISTVSSATLRVYGSSTAATTLTAYATTDGWSNAAISWNNAPAASQSVGQVAMTTAAKYYEIDVTAYVQAQAGSDKTASFVLNESAGKYTTFSSSDSATNKPQLVIK